MSAADKIKNFFKKKKTEAKFKLAGPGRRLDATEPTTSSSKTSKDRDVYVPPQRNELTAEARTAAEAALARVQGQKKDSVQFNTSMAAIRAQVQRELEAEKKAKQELEKTSSCDREPKILTDEHNRNLAAQGVYFRCPMIGDEILPRHEWKAKIKEFLYEQLEGERGLTACLIILNCNTKEKSTACIETLSKYLENIIQHPDEEKYRKIRKSNRIFAEKVQPCEGAIDFLLGAGFTEQDIDGEPFLIYSNESDETDGIDALKELLEALHHSEIIPLELDRNIQVLLPSQAKRSELPPDFYRISTEELKREQQLRTEALENASILKTKAMREREELRYINRYKFALIRVRFPDGVYLQGTFSVYEKLSQVYEFVQSCLKNENIDFKLMSPIGTKFDDDDDLNKTLHDLRLIPNTVLTFTTPESAETIGGNYLKEDLLMLIQPV